MRAAIRAELDRLKAKSKDGRLMPRAVIAAARSPKSPLHAAFTWDKNKALEQNLLREAQTLIAEYTVVMMHGDKAIKTRHFVSLTTDRRNGGGYRVVSEVLDDETMTRQLLADALAELASFQAKYRRLSELAGVFAEIERVQERHAPVRRRRGGEDRAAA